MAVAPLQIPSYAAPQALDWSPLAKLGEVLQTNRKNAEYGRIGRGIADGTIDYRQAAGSLADLGNPDAMFKFLALAETKDKQAKELAASNQVATSLSGLLGGAPATTGSVAAPASSAPASAPSFVNPGPVMPPVNGAPARPPVAPSARVWGDEEAEAAGLYEPRPGSPTQNPAPMTLADLRPPQAAPVAPTAAVTDRPPTPPVPQASPQSASPAVQPSPANGFQGLNATHIPTLLQAVANPYLPAGQKDMVKTLLTRALDESKTPDKVKVLQQIAAQSGYRGTLLDLEKELRAAGKTEITLDQKAETAEAKAAGEAAGKRRAEMFAAAGSAGKTLTNLSRMEGLLGQLEQGKLSPAKLNVSAWAKSFGLNDEVAARLGFDPKGAASAQALQSLVAESVLSKIGSGGLPANNFSDADREFLVSIFPRIANEPGANKILIEGARRMVQLDIERAKAFQAFKRDPANKARGFEDFELEWANKMSNRDLFGDLRREAESIVGAPRDDIGGTLNNPGAAPARQPHGASGSWGDQPAAQVASPDDARRLPPGTRFVTPDGREFVR